VSCQGFIGCASKQPNIHGRILHKKSNHCKLQTTKAEVKELQLEAHLYTEVSKRAGRTLRIRPQHTKKADLESKRDKRTPLVLCENVAPKQIRNARTLHLKAQTLQFAPTNKQQSQAMRLKKCKSLISNNNMLLRKRITKANKLCVAHLIENLEAQ